MAEIPFDIVEDIYAPEGFIYLMPRIEGLTLVGDELKVALKVYRASKTVLQYRDLTDDEKKRFGVIKL